MEHAGAGSACRNVHTAQAHDPRRGGSTAGGCWSPLVSVSLESESTHCAPRFRRAVVWRSMRACGVSTIPYHGQHYATLSCTCAVGATTSKSESLSDDNTITCFRGFATARRFTTSVLDDVALEEPRMSRLLCPVPGLCRGPSAGSGGRSSLAPLSCVRLDVLRPAMVARGRWRWRWRCWHSTDCCHRSVQVRTRRSGATQTLT